MNEILLTKAFGIDIEIIKKLLGYRIRCATCKKFKSIELKEGKITVLCDCGCGILKIPHGKKDNFSWDFIQQKFFVHGFKDLPGSEREKIIEKRHEESLKDARGF